LGEIFDDLLENLSRSAEPPRALLNFSTSATPFPTAPRFSLAWRESGGSGAFGALVFVGRRFPIP
jgi:hypothetical protein